MQHPLYPLKKLLLGAAGLVCLLGLSLTAAAQTGTIRGQVLDSEYNEALIGATVFLEGTQRGANTDLDGQFSMDGVPVGTYTIVFTYVSYEKVTVTDVVVEEGKVTVVNVVLKPEGTTVEEVVITAKQLEISEASLLNMQFKSSNTLDGLGSRQMSRIGDSDAGGAIRRVVGVTVEGGKYVYVRGLGDRYGKTLVNGAEIPGLDPSRNSVQIDLFPTAILDNLLIYKTYTPDLPGSFTGGLVDIRTRDFPDRFTVNVSVSAGYNTQATFNSDYLTYDGSNLDWLGFGNGDRKLPSFFEQNVPNIESAGERLSNLELTNAVTNSVRPQWNPITESAPLDHSITFSLGNQTTLFGKTLGYIVGISYRRQYTYLDGSQGLYILQTPGANEYLTVQEFEDKQGIDEVLWSALANLSLKLNDKNKISLNLMRTQSGTTSGRFLDGQKNEGTTEIRYQEVRILNYIQRSNSIFQLRGTHVLGDKAWEIDWIGSFTATVNLQPDFRTWAVQYELQPDGSKGTYNFSNTTGDPIRFYRELFEDNLDLKLNFTKYLTSWVGTEGKIKFGGAWLNRLGRKFDEKQYNYRYEGDVETSGSPRSINSYINDLDGYFSPANNFYDAGANGFYYAFATNFVNSYTADENIYGVYAMVDMDIAEKLRLVAGARYERTEISVTPEDAVTAYDGIIEQDDILPSLSLIYNLTEKSNIRANYSNTVARPVFREIAPFTQFDFVGGIATTGNDDLDRSLSTNLDLRYEFFPNPGEVFAISAYYKLIDKPIEKALLTEIVNIADSPVVTWSNVDEATVYGVELDFRKDFGFISENLRRLKLSINFSYTFSEVNVPEAELALGRTLNPEIEDTRELFGQSPYVINTSLAYAHEETGTTYTIAFNRFGERLILVATAGTPNYYEQPRNSLDINILQKIGGADGRWTLRLGASNILNPEVRWTSEYRGREYDFINYKEGVVLTLGASYSFSK